MPTRQQLDQARGSHVSLRQWSTSVLHALDIQPNRENVRALSGWARAEGGHWNNTARYNPLNTTQPMPGARDTGTQGNIKVYRNWHQGIKATVETLRNGHYGGIIHALKSGTAGDVASAIGNSPWGTSASLISSVIHTTPAMSPAHHVIATNGVKQPVSAAGGKYSLTARGGAIQKGTGPRIIPGGTTVDKRAAMVAALLDNRKGMSLLDRFHEQTASGDYTTTTPTTVDPGTGDRFVQGQKLTVSGQSGPPAKAARLPDGPEPTSDRIEGALGWAKSKLGATESGGANRGPLVDRIERRFGMTGQAWCGMFVGTALQKAGVKGIDSRIASVAAIEQMAKSGTGGMKRWLSPVNARRGDLLVPAAGQHVVMVTGRSGDIIHTIGGNSSDSVRRVDYRASSSYGVARPRYHQKHK